MVRLLAENGASLYVENNSGGVICNAAWDGRLDIVCFLIEEYNCPVEAMNYHGILFDPNVPNPVAIAARQGYVSTIDFLVSKGASILQYSVVWAAENGYSEVIQWLAKHNYDLDFPLYGKAALYEAIRREHVTTVATLLELGAKFGLGLKTGEETRLVREFAT